MGWHPRCPLLPCSALSLTVDIHRLVPYLPPSNAGHMGYRTHLRLLNQALSSPLCTTPLTMSTLRSTQRFLRPLQHALNTGLHRVSLALLYTHKSWSTRLCCDAIDKSHAHPKPRKSSHRDSLRPRDNLWRLMKRLPSSFFAPVAPDLNGFMKPYSSSSPLV